MEHNVTKILEPQPIFGDTQRHFRCCATSHIPPHCLYQTQPNRASSSDCYSLSPLLPTIKNGDRPTDAAGTRTSCPANASQISLAPATRQRAHPSRTRVPSGHPRARTEGGLAATGTGSNRGGLTIDERSAVTIDARYICHEICSHRNISTSCAESRTDLRRLLGKERRRRRGNAAGYPVREWGCFLFFVNAGRDGSTWSFAPLFCRRWQRAMR